MWHHYLDFKEEDLLSNPQLTGASLGLEHSQLKAKLNK